MSDDIELNARKGNFRLLAKLNITATTNETKLRPERN